MALTAIFNNPKLFTGAGTVPASSAVPAKVYVRDNWDGPWIENKYIIPKMVLFRAGNSGFGQAEFLYRYGPVSNKKTGQGDWTVIPKADYIRWFIKVEFDGRTWVGQINDQVDQPGGQDVKSGEVSIPVGSMVISAISLESLFHYAFVTKSFYADFERGPSPSRPRFGIAQSGLTFNDGGRQNMVADGSDRYFTTRSRASYWSTRDIIQYAVANWSPVLQSGLSGITVTLDAADAAYLPDWDRPVLQTHGYRAIEVINRLVTRRRLLMWWLDYSDNGLSTDTLKFRVKTVVADPLDVGDGTIPGNPDQFSFFVGFDSSAEYVVNQDANSYVDLVVAEGARQRNVFTVAFDDHPTRHVGKYYWVDQDEIEYESGGKNFANYPAAEKRGERQKFHAKFRGRAKYRDVFSRFGLDLSRPLPHRDPLKYEMPAFEARLLPTLPLLEGRDYSGNRIKNQIEVFDNSLLEPEMAPIAFLRLAEPLELPGEAVWVDASKIGLSNEGVPAKSAETAYNFSCSMSVVPDTPSFRLEVSGEQQHVLSSKPRAVAQGTGGTFEPLPEDKATIGNIDWHEMMATVCLEDDRRASGSFPATYTPGATLPLRTLRIEAGDDYRVDWVDPGTVVDVDLERNQLVTSSGGYFRDDRDKLLAIATRAWRYYSVIRGILRFTCAYQNPQVYQPGARPVSLGHIVTTVRDTTKSFVNVNSVISEFKVTFPVREADVPIASVDPPRMEVTTSYGELTPDFFVPKQKSSRRPSRKQLR